VSVIAEKPDEHRMGISKKFYCSFWLGSIFWQTNYDLMDIQ
jgi:hypothetical protein